MQMGLAHDYGAGLSQARSYGGVSRSDAILFCIEMGPASGGVARDIEAIFNPDRDAKERRPPRRVREARGEGLRFREHAFAIQREIYVSANVAVGARKRFLRL
jgi:hypothetical protein